jgi:hypothetical protein
MSIDAMKQALEALDSDNPDIQLRAAIALRTAIAEAERQEPVAWLLARHEIVYFEFEEWMHHSTITPVYTAPPAAQRQWVGLTDEEIEAEFGFIDELLRDCCYRTAAKLKEKNA